MYLALISAGLSMAFPPSSSSAINPPQVLDRLWTEARSTSLHSSIVRFDAGSISGTSLSVSPKGGTIIFSVLGDIYALPTSGGVARLIHGGPSWDTAPSYSPDGRKIAFISDLDGGDRHIWIMEIRGGRVAKLDTPPVVAFGWGSHSNEIYFTKKEGYHAPPGPLYRMDLRTGSRSLVAGSFDLMTWNGASADKYGQQATFLSQKRQVMLVQPNKAFLTEQLAGLSFPSKSSPVLSSDGRRIAFLSTGSSDGEDVSRQSTIRLLIYDLGSRAVSLVATWPTDSPLEGQDLPHLSRLAFGRGGNLIFAYINGGIHKVDLVQRTVEKIPLSVPISMVVKRPKDEFATPSDDGDQTKVARWASMPDRADSIVFQAAGKIWWRDRRNGIVRRLTKSSDLEYAPAVSPNGSEVVYVALDHNDRSRLMAASISTGTSRVLEAAVAMYANPEWTPDGKEIIFIRDPNKPADRANSLGLYGVHAEIRRIPAEGTRSQFVTSISMPNFKWDRTVFKLAAAGNPLRIYFTNEGPGRGGAGRQLVSVNMDGSDRKTHLIFKDHMFGALPSPDGRRFVVATRYENWIIAPERLGSDLKTDYSTLKATGVRIDSEGSSYDSLTWGVNGITWSFGGKFYQWRSSSRNVAVEALGAPISKRTNEALIAYINARIVTSSKDGVIDLGTVLVRGNRIVNVLSIVPQTFTRGTLVVDLRGKTIIPGLINTHSHIHSNSEYHPYQDEQLVGHLAYGITTAFDPAGPLIGHLAWNEAIEAGEVLGPRIYTAGPQFQEISRGWGQTQEQIAMQAGGTSVLQRATSISDAGQVTDALASAGAKMVKTRGLVRRDEMMWIGASAAQSGIPATAHIEYRSEASNFTAIVDGFRALEHFYPQSTLYDDEIGFYGQTKAFFTPTDLISYYSSACSEIEGSRTLANPKERRFGFYEPRAAHLDEILPMNITYHLKENDFVVAQLKRLSDAGAIVTLGAETNNGGPAPHCHIWALVHGGFSPLEAIRIATINGARKIGQEKNIGSIEDGKLADFLVLNSNPLEDIRRTADIAYVVFDGRVFDGETLTELFPKYSELHTPRWVKPAEWSKYGGQRLRIAQPPGRVSRKVNRN